LKTALTVVGAGVGPLPSKQDAVLPYPTKSITLEPNGHPLPVSRVLLFTSATLPAVEAIAIVPTTSGVGRLTVPPVPAPSSIKKYPPGGIDPVRLVFCQVVPAAEAY